MDISLAVFILLSTESFWRLYHKQLEYDTGALVPKNFHYRTLRYNIFKIIKTKI